MRLPSIVFMVLALALCAGPASGQTTSNAPAAPDSPRPAAEDEANRWSFSPSIYAYFLPDSTAYAQPTLALDRGRLHLEARYNYEDLETGSAWIGCNFSGGEDLAWEITPMLGGVFGGIAGVAPGYKGSLGWWKLELYSEGEYVFDLGEAADSFFYNWSELTVAPVDGLRLGLVTQRTRVRGTDRDIQRGVLAGFSYKALSVTAYALNPGSGEPTVVIAAGLPF